MTPQERELLEGFLSNLEKMHATNVDTEAEALIRRAIYNQPQAPYLLVQQMLLQQIALRDAQAQITRIAETIGASSRRDWGAFWKLPGRCPGYWAGY